MHQRRNVNMASPPCCWMIRFALAKVPCRQRAELRSAGQPGAAVPTSTYLPPTGASDFDFHVCSRELAQRLFIWGAGDTFFGDDGRDEHRRRYIKGGVFDLDTIWNHRLARNRSEG